MHKSRKVLVISPGIEDAGMRGLGRVTLALIDGLAAAGYEPYLLTGAPIKKIYMQHQEARKAAVRRYIDHYLYEGISSPAFTLKRMLIARAFISELFSLFLLRRAAVIPSSYPVPTQHKPAAIRHFLNLSGFVNFGLFYKIASRIPKRLSSAIVFALAKHCGANIIITSSPYPLKRPLFRHRNIKIVQYIHDVMPLHILETPPGSAKKFAFDITAAVKDADYIMTSSVNAKDKLQAILPHLNPRVVYLPCNPVSARPTVHDIGIASEIGIKKNRYILFMSALERRKNVVRLLEAFDLIANKTDFKLVIVGSQAYGWDEIEHKLNSLRPQIRKRIILTGYVSEEDKWSLLSHCGLVVHPAIDEGLGIPVIEALLAKKPVVATRLNSIEEFSPVGCVTYIEDPYNVYEIADKLLVGIKGRRTVGRRLESGSAVMAEVFSEHAFRLRLESVLKTVYEQDLA